MRLTIVQMHLSLHSTSTQHKREDPLALYKDSLSLRAITAKLKEHGIPSPRGNPVWQIETVRKILNNEKYYGDVLLQKTYVSDYFTGKQSPNNGEMDQYLIEGHHDGIVK